MSITIITNEDLQNLIDGKSVNIEFGPFGVTIAAERWIRKQRDAGNILESPCKFCEDLSDKGSYYDDNFMLYRDNRIDILADTGDSFQWGCIEDVKYCPYCGRRLLKND